MDFILIYTHKNQFVYSVFYIFPYANKGFWFVPISDTTIPPCLVYLKSLGILNLINFIMADIVHNLNYNMVFIFKIIPSFLTMTLF